jgi:hypothetical protein
MEEKKEENCHRGGTLRPTRRRQYPTHNGNKEMVAGAVAAGRRMLQRQRLQAGESRIPTKHRSVARG